MNDEARVAELRKLFAVVEHWTYLYNGSIHPYPRPVGDAMRAFLDQWQNGGERCGFAMEYSSPDESAGVCCGFRFTKKVS